MASIAAAIALGGCDRKFCGLSAKMFERDGSVSERENVECVAHVLVVLPKRDDPLQRPVALVIESIERIAFFACFPLSVCPGRS
jgi:hypothetical protein